MDRNQGDVAAEKNEILLIPLAHAIVNPWAEMRNFYGQRMDFDGKFRLPMMIHFKNAAVGGKWELIRNFIVFFLIREEDRRIKIF